MTFPIALLEKYSTPGPRYTSYPTAPYFTGAVGEKEWRDELAAHRASPRGLSLYVHIPFCDTLCYYCGCNMVATRDYAKAQRYLEHLLREIDLLAVCTGSARRVEQLHWGGGTPTFLRPAEILRLSTHLRGRFDFAADAEAGCEVDPGGLTREQIQALAAAGFNRISIGVQDLDPRVQRAVNRLQPEPLIRQVMDWVREAGFQSVNVDLMVGLPLQTPGSFVATLDKIVDMRPDRIAAFSYAHVPWLKRHQRLIREQDLPDFPTRLALQALLFERLGAAGYVYIGLDHFARPQDELVLAQQRGGLYRNFQGYTTHKHCDVYGLGVSAISQTEGCYAQNSKRLIEYQDRVAAGELPIERGVRLTRDDRIRRDAITALMCDLALDRAAFARTWQIDFDAYFKETLHALKPLQDDGLVTLDSKRIAVTERGRLFLRNIAMCFDAYLLQAPQAAHRYSRTV